MRNAAHPLVIAAAAAAALLAACAADTAKEIVGSKKVASKTTPTMVVENVDIYIPFKGVVHNGSPRQIVIRGEDNLLSQITVHESTPSKWQISASPDLMFQQHSDLQIEIPFIDMVQISYNGDLSFADQPFLSTREGADAGAK